MKREKHVPTLKVPRQCPFVLLIKVRLREGKASRCEGDREVRSIVEESVKAKSHGKSKRRFIVGGGGERASFC
jgi:hypothetical protein